MSLLQKQQNHSNENQTNSHKLPEPTYSPLCMMHPYTRLSSHWTHELTHHIMYKDNYTIRMARRHSILISILNVSTHQNATFWAYTEIKSKRGFWSHNLGKGPGTSANTAFRPQRLRKCNRRHCTHTGLQYTWPNSYMMHCMYPRICGTLWYMGQNPSILGTFWSTALQPLHVRMFHHFQSTRRSRLHGKLHCPDV